MSKILMSMFAGIGALISSDYAGAIKTLGKKEKSGFINSKQTAFTKGKRAKSLKVRSNRLKAKRK